VARDGSVYDFFLHVRPDVAFLAPFPLEALEVADSVTSRAHKLCFNTSAHWLSQQALSAPLPHLQCMRCDPCSAMPDDQLALVPRLLAAAYFTEHLFADARQPHRTMPAREAEYTLMTTNVVAGDAPGPVLSPPMNLSKRYEDRRLAGGAVRCGYWKGGASAAELDTQPSTAFGAEANLLYRMRLRQVPLVVRALPAHLTRYSGGHLEPMYMGWPNASRSCSQPLHSKTTRTVTPSDLL
jgi:hypothetical protein